MMYRRWFTLYVFAISLLAGGTAQAATILVFGDSISAAYGMETRQGWVTLLQQHLNDVAPGKHSVINGSLSGETTAGGLKRLPPLLQQHRPDIVILELGGNDGLRGQPPALMKQNLLRMVTAAKKSGASVILLGMKIPPNYGKAYTTAFEQVFVAVSQSSGSKLMPFFLEGVGGNPTLIQKDGIHPTAQAQKKLLNNVLPILLPELKKYR
jgi:acyl-CoA thioesterase-1